MVSVLVVDDEKGIRITLKAFLTDAGYEVCIAEDGRAALKMLEEGSFDVLVSDIIMPGFSGVELLKSVKKTSPHIQVILMTGEPTSETASEALRAGAFDYLAKPIHKDKLLLTVANAAKVESSDD